MREIYELWIKFCSVMQCSKLYKKSTLKIIRGGRKKSKKINYYYLDYNIKAIQVFKKFDLHKLALIKGIKALKFNFKKYRVFICP